MDLTPHVAALRDDLSAAAAVGDEATARAGSALAAALEPAVRLALLNALSDLAAEVSDALDDHTVGLRLRGREVDAVVTRDGGSSSRATEGPVGGAGPFAASVHDRHFDPPDFTSPGFPYGGRQGAAQGPDVGDISRMTLRLVDQIKGQAEQAAASQGMSLNSWVAQAVQGALRGQGGWPRGGHDRGGDDRGGHDRGESGGGAGPGASGPGSPEPGGPGTAGGRGPSGRPGDDGGDDGVQGWVRG